MKTSLPFAKMHALGNDFIVVNNLTFSFPQDKTTLTQLSDRHCGIGFDQALFIEPSTSADFFCRIFNTDGSEAAQCGNGLRAVARYLQDKKLQPQLSLTIETLSGIFPVEYHDNGEITVTMGPPQSPITAVSLTVMNQPLAVQLVSMGNPHCIIRVENSHHAPVALIGDVLNHHAEFPDGVNVGFMEIMNAHHVRLRTYERGAGETLACGSNACAAAVVGLHEGMLTSPVQIEFKLGSVMVTWEGGSHPIQLKGSATWVFEGLIPSLNDSPHQLP